MRWLTWFTRRDRDADLDRELRAHLDLEAEERQESGLTPEDAGYAARRAFGSVTRTREETRETWGWTWLERLGQDLRYAGRVMRRRPGFTIAAVVSLTLGIGANTAVFSILNALLLESLPVHRPHELVRVVDENREFSREEFAYPSYDALRRGSRLLSSVIVMSTPGPRPGVIVERDEEQRAFIQMVSDNYFDALGVSAARGRVFHASGRTAPGEVIAVISDAFWRRHYGADPSALGARFRAYSRREVVVAGIAPPGFHGTSVDFPTDIWVPFEQMVPANSDDRTRGRWLQIMGRLKPGETPARAEAEASAILSRPVKLARGAIGYSNLRGRLSGPLLLVELVVVLVMLLTCANLANLMLADAASREHELAVRRAVGASRGRIVRQLLTEAVVLSTAGGVFALIAAHWMSAALLSFLSPAQAPARANLDFEPDLRVLGFAALLSFLTCALFGLVPALRATRPPNVQRNRNWMSRGLVVCEVSMCTLLLIVAGVFVRTVQNLRSQQTGYQEDRLLVAEIGFPRPYSEDERDRLIEQLRARAARLPGVEIAAFSHIGQLSGGGIEYKIRVPGKLTEQPDEGREEIFEQRVSPGFLAAMGTRLGAGRDFTDADTDGSLLVAIVNEAFARRFMLGSNPVGQRFIKEGGSRRIQTIEIVGVVMDAKWINLREPSPAMYYIPYKQNAGTPVVRFAIRAHGDLHVLAARLADAAHATDRRMTVRDAVPFGEIVNRTLMIERLIAQVSAAFAVLALLMAAVGLYGVLAYGVVRRRREIGVRIAVGASPGSVEWMVLRESLALLGIGFVIGVPAALLITRLVSSMLFGLGPHDPVTVGATLAALTIATLAAAYFPARRAANIDPILALRAD